MKLKEYKQFYMFKFNSQRLHKVGYKVDLTVKEAYHNEEMIALGDNQLFRTIRELQNRSVSYTKKETLFMPEVISIIVEHKQHYKNLIKSGVIINGNKFVRFLCGAGHARNNTVYFIREDLFGTVDNIFKNGHSETLKMNAAKYNAYFGLYASASKVVSPPSVCVVKDFKFNSIKKVDWIEGDNITVIDKELEFNAFDGQGLISPDMSSLWSEDLKLGYTASQFIIRAPFVKGMLATFDFHSFAEENRVEKIEDIWGNVYNIKNIDVILSESQFKLWAGYSSWEDYEKNRKKNKLTWGVTRTNPKKDKDVAFTNYQYIQTLNLSDEDIRGLCEPTVNWLNGVATDVDPIQAVLFLLGDKFNDIYEVMSAKDLNIAKAVVLNNELLKNSYVKNRILKMIDRKLKDACMGKLAVRGNYSMMIADPYAQAQHSLGLTVTGLLKEREYYSYYWISKGVKLIDSCRSPMTHYSEHNLLNLKEDVHTEKYYAYLTSGTIINIWGDDCMRYADADFDGDILMSTDNEYFIKGVHRDLLPITYEKKSAPKENINFESCTRADLSSFDTKIGVITNYSTSLYALESRHSGEKLDEIQKRLKILRREQGNQIDKAKGIQITGFPQHWVKWSKREEEDTDEILEFKQFNNDIMIEKKPYFMIYVYPKLHKELKTWLYNMSQYSKKMFGCDVDVLKMKKGKTTEEEEFLITYNKYIPVDMSPCTMNRLSNFMEGVHLDLKQWKSRLDDTDYILMNGLEWQQHKYNKVKKIYSSHQESLRNAKIFKELTGEEDFYDKDYEKELLLEKLLKVCPERELVNYCVMLPNKSFVWGLELDAMLTNIYNNRQEEVWLPVEDENGESVYLNKRYTKRVCEI